MTRVGLGVVGLTTVKHPMNLKGVVLGVMRTTEDHGSSRDRDTPLTKAD
jgi:hypothetical protein